MPGVKHKYIVVVESAKDKAYHFLRKKIVNLELRPGTLISTQNISDEMEISRTPVREAFLKLQEENLLEISHQKPSMVSRIDPIRVRQECFVRQTLETENLRLFMQKPSSYVIEKMQEKIAKQKEALKIRNYELYQELDNEFHLLPFSETGQDLAANVIRTMNGHYDRSRMLIRKSEDLTNDIIGEHEQLLKIITSGDIEQSVELLRSHIEAINPIQDMLMQSWPDYFV